LTSTTATSILQNGWSAPLMPLIINIDTLDEQNKLPATCSSQPPPVEHGWQRCVWLLSPAAHVGRGC
jgi:hypothetical protein